VCRDVNSLFVAIQLFRYPGDYVRENRPRANQAHRLSKALGAASSSSLAVLRHRRGEARSHDRASLTIRAKCRSHSGCAATSPALTPAMHPVIEPSPSPGILVKYYRGFFRWSAGRAAFLLRQPAEVGAWIGSPTSWPSATTRRHGMRPCCAGSMSGRC
jgi:hypothetical protein